ncbi:unnamed protein product, partial [Laminaria digitata]
VFVVNLTFSTKDSGLKNMFRGCGAISGSRVLTNPQGRSKGMGYVTFETEEAVTKALTLNGTEVDGRVITVQKSLPRGSRPPKGGGDKNVKTDNKNDNKSAKNDKKGQSAEIDNKNDNKNVGRNDKNSQGAADSVVVPQSSA